MSIIKIIILLVIVFIIIMSILRFIKKRKFKNEIFDKENPSLDFNNIINSINNSRDLYKKLISIYHPDRYTSEEDKKIANEISMEITMNKRDYNKLKEIENKSKYKLKI